jgi:hypothetical protein
LYALPAVLALALAAPATAFAENRGGETPGERPTWCQPDSRGQYDAARMPERFRASDCDIQGAVVRRGAVGVEAPPAGTGVAMEALGAGHGLGEDIAVSFDGVSYTIDPATIEATQQSNLPADCSDTTQGAGTDRKARTTLNWALRSSTVPGNVGITNTLSAVSAGRNNLVYHNNNCGENRDPNVPIHSYVGGATATGGFSSDVKTCAANTDSANVVEWASMGTSGFIAAVCSWKNSTGGITGFDMRFKQ